MEFGGLPAFSSRDQATTSVAAWILRHQDKRQHHRDAWLNIKHLSSEAACGTNYISDDSR
jgi:hypothetical protein